MGRTRLRASVALANRKTQIRFGQHVRIALALEHLAPIMPI